MKLKIFWSYSTLGSTIRKYDKVISITQHICIYTLIIIYASNACHCCLYCFLLLPQQTVFNLNVPPVYIYVYCCWCHACWSHYCLPVSCWRVCLLWLNFIYYITLLLCWGTPLAGLCEHVERGLGLVRVPAAIDIQARQELVGSKQQNIGSIIAIDDLKPQREQYVAWDRR